MAQCAQYGEFARYFKDKATPAGSGSHSEKSSSNMALIASPEPLWADRGRSFR
jgi:hypothetical protein